MRQAKETLTMSISSPCTDFDVDCYKSPDGRVWWYYSFLRNGRRHNSYNSYTSREAAYAAMIAAKIVETA